MNTEFTLSERARIYTLFTMNESSSAQTGLLLNTSGLVGLPAGYNYAGVSDLGTYSDLRVRQFQQVVGMEYRVFERLVLQQELWWRDYQDGEPYLFDANGRNIGFRFSLNWLF